MSILREHRDWLIELRRKRTIGTKAQQALKKQFEQSKIAKKKASKDRKREDQERRFLQKQVKP